MLIGLAIVLVIIAAFFMFLRLAFGPLHDSITIDLGTEGELVCDETYNADLADVFYDVKMILKAANGKKWDLGSVTFHDQDWTQQIKPRRVGDWLIIPLEPEDFVQVKMLNILNGELTDTTLVPFDLRKDSLYKERFKKRPDHLYPGTSKITEISDDMIEVSYEYKAKAEFPSEILVNQIVVYEINLTNGKLQTKEIRDRVVQ